MIYFMCISVQGSLWHKGLREAFKGTVCFGFLFNQSEINKGHWSTSGADSRDDSTFRQKCQFTEGKDRFGMFGINFKQKRLISKTTQETPQVLADLKNIIISGRMNKSWLQRSDKTLLHSCFEMKLSFITPANQAERSYVEKALFSILKE